MPYSPESIHERLILDLIPVEHEEKITNAVSKLPHKIINFVIENILFISTVGANYLPLKGYPFEGHTGVILLDSEVFSTESLDFDRLVAHEVAHAVHGDGVGVTEEREVLADKRSVEWLKPHYGEKDLRGLCHYWKKKKIKKRGSLYSLHSFINIYGAVSGRYD